MKYIRVAQDGVQWLAYIIFGSMQEKEFIGKLSDYQIHEKDSGHGLSWLRGCMGFLNYYLESAHEYCFRIISSSVLAFIQSFHATRSELLTASLGKLLVQVLGIPCSVNLCDGSL